MGKLISSVPREASLLSVTIQTVRSVPLEIKNYTSWKPCKVPFTPLCKGESMPSPLLSVVNETAMVNQLAALNPPVEQAGTYAETTTPIGGSPPRSTIHGQRAITVVRWCAKCCTVPQ